MVRRAKLEDNRGHCLVLRLGLRGKDVSVESDLIEKLTVLNHIAETLNQAVDVHSVLGQTLEHLVKLMGLETGWIFLQDPAAQERWWGQGYVLAAHYNLPPALDLESAEAWERGCDCQDLCSRSCLTEAYNVMRCGRLGDAHGDRQGLAMHASAPLRSGDRILGILNVAGEEQSLFTPQALALLTNVGSQIGVALERARLFDLLQERRVHEQTMLLAFSSQLLGRPHLDDLMDYLVEQVPTMLQADACTLLLPNGQPGVVDVRAAGGWRADPVVEGRRITADEWTGPGLVMRTQKPLLVDDVSQDPSTRWMPDWLRAEGFRGHAGVPLIAGGHSIGVLLVSSRQPRTLDGNEMRLLRLLANQAAMAIEKARLHQEEVKGQGLERELAVAKQIQLSLLPQAAPVVPGWEFVAFYQPARSVGGDFYDFFMLPGDPGSLGLVIADVAGKGMPAALFMALGRTTVRTAALGGRSPSAALERANEWILNDSWTELFLTAFYAALDTRSGRLVYARAGHNPPLWLRAVTGESEELTASGIALGMFGGITLQERGIDIMPGDLLVLYTDGVTEAMDASGQPFGEERLRRLVTAQAGVGAQQALAAVVEAVEAHTGGVPLSDDITLLVVKRSVADG